MPRHATRSGWIGKKIRISIVCSAIINYCNLLFNAIDLGTLCRRYAPVLYVYASGHEGISSVGDSSHPYSGTCISIIEILNSAKMACRIIDILPSFGGRCLRQ